MVGNLQDYLRWRGDLSLAAKPFNVVDNLVLSALANVDLSGIVPSPDAGGWISVAQASESLRQKPSRLLDPRRLIFVPDVLVHQMAKTERFRDARLSNYVDVTAPDTGVQFAALTVHLDDGSAYVAFRGTDTSIVGWKEDFVMSFELIPSQTMALEYLSAAVKITDGQVRVGGHSKGGNLAIYATGHLSEAQQDRVCTVFNNDGPGLSPEAWQTGGMDRISDRIIRIGPQFSVIGMVFNESPPDKIVFSTGHGIMQHDVMTWQVQGDTLREQAGLAAGAIEINHAITAWLNEAGDTERRQVTDAVFSALSAGGATLLQDVSKGDFGSVESVILSLARSRGKLRAPTRIALKTVAHAFATVNYPQLFSRWPALRMAAIAFVGLFFIQVPGLAVQVLASLALAGLCVVLGVRIIRYFLGFRQRHKVRWVHLAAVVVLILLIIATSTQISLLIIPGNLLLGVCFLLGGWGSGRAGLTAIYSRPRQIPRAVLLWINAVVATLFGIVALTTANLVLPFFIQQAGLYCLVAGVLGLFLVVRDEAALQYRRSQNS